MTFLNRTKKADLITLADELGLEVGENLKVLQLVNLITSDPNYDESVVKDMLQSITDDRLASEERENREKEKRYELEKLQLQIECQRLAAVDSAVSIEPPQSSQKIDTNVINTLLPKFDPKQEDLGTFFTVFERQVKFMNLPESSWIPYLLGTLPADIAALIVREPEEFQNYLKVKDMLLKRFKFTGEKFRQFFVSHRKDTEKTWRDFFFDLCSYFDGWLAELGVDSFDKLRQLIIADQIKKKVPPDMKEHFLDIWSEWIAPIDLAEKLDAYENARSGIKKTNLPMHQKKQNPSKPSFQERRNRYSKPDNLKQEKPEVTCYGCGTPGVIKPNCPTCGGKNKKSGAFSSIILQSASIATNQVATLEVTINGLKGTACADTAATHSIAGEVLYQLLKKQGVIFATKTLLMSLADGSLKSREVHTTLVKIRLGGRTLLLNLVAIPEAKGNNTLLGVDFLESSGIVLNMKRKSWSFSDQPRRQFSFVEQNQSSCASVQTNASKTVAPLTVNENDHPDHVHEDEACLTLQKQKQNDHPDHLIEDNSLISQQKKFNDHPDHLREDEGTHLTADQRKKLNNILSQFESIFTIGGEATPYIEHYIDTQNHPPVSVPPYRVSPARKEVMKNEIERLLAEGIIEPCESPYAAPVVLIPKPDGTYRFCVDYRKLNAITKTDSYPLPRIDDLLQDAKHTRFMSTIDLRAGYHQVNVAVSDRDKTAFICPFGTYRFKRMPFGLKNAPATFQRLIDKFRSGLNDIFLLSYLDDIIVLSATFEEHLSNLKDIFQRLTLFKLSANRAKCNFACSKVKYLGHYITPEGLQVDPAKTAAIQDISEPKTVKQVQSFLQTCSWYRRFIPNFSEIARPLSNLTKKSNSWLWTEKEQAAFKQLKTMLTEPPVLRQCDPNEPYILRTDASGYALGAVLLQGKTVEDQHPIEYASRLLTSAERNYTTTEREALAVVWALGKFRCYIEGQEVTVATDHQALRWLMSLKSPSGRLARWALQLQEFNLHIEYIPGKSNLVADMLSRPACHQEENPCEICKITINQPTVISVDFPTRTPKEVRESQLQDENLKKIINGLEAVNPTEEYRNWTERGFLMNRGVLYRYAPDSESDEAQLVIPEHEREKILKIHHDDPTAGHYGAEGTFDRISRRYHWTGMRKYITDYVKDCIDCMRYKPSNQKPSGLLQTPVPCQRFETLSIDLFGPLPISHGKKWIFIVEDLATKWVELFSLENATAQECAATLVEEIVLRYGIPRRIVSDNGSQFVSAVMQQLCYLLSIHQSLTPVYHPQANPVERKNRDLKPRLAILVNNRHETWAEKLPAIRFALNTSKCISTGKTAAFLNFGRELRTIDDVTNDFRGIIENDNFVIEMTPYLQRLERFTAEAKEVMLEQQDRRKSFADQKRKPAPLYNTGDLVLVTKPNLSNKGAGVASKFMPRRDGPFVIVKQRSPVSYSVANPDFPNKSLGVYHTSALTPFYGKKTSPIQPLRKRGRPPKNHQKSQKEPTRGLCTNSPTPANPAAKENKNSQRLPADPWSGRLRGQRGRL